MIRPRLVVVGYFSAVVMVALAAMLWITPLGAGVSPDSTIYIGAARSLLSGEGFTANGRPITQYPPLFSVFLAAVGLFQPDLVQAARLLNSLLLAANVGLVALLVHWSAGRHFVTTSLAVLSCLVSAPFVEVHAWAWSEPLFIALCLCSILALSLHLARPSACALIVSSVCLGAAMVTRYAGAAFVPAGAILLLVGGRKPLRRRLAECGVWLALTCAPLVTLLAANTALAGSAANRSLVVHPVALDQFLGQVVATLAGFVLPAQVLGAQGPYVWALLAVALVAPPAVVLFRCRGAVEWRSPGTLVPVACFLIVGSYLPFLLASISFLDAATPVDARLLSPVLPFLIVAVFAMEWNASRWLRRPAIWWGFSFLVAVSIVARMPDSARAAAQIRDDGLGFSARQWRSSETVAFLASLGDEVTIYSNGANALAYLTGKSSKVVPVTNSPTTGLVNPDYTAAMDALCRDVTEGNAVLAYFDLVPERWFYPTRAELESTCGLPGMRRLSDGYVYSPNID